MIDSTTRRSFLASSVGLLAAGVASQSAAAMAFAADPKFKISLAQWSLHRAIKGGKLDNLDFAATTKKEFGIEGVEYVNQFFKDKANDKKYLAEMNKRAADNGVTQLLIMIDGEGQLGDASLTKRAKAVENHYKWVEAAKELGCHSIRVNAGSSGSREEQIHRAADGLRALSEFGDKHGINVIVENHGGLSSDGDWLSTVIKKVDHKRCGTLPDFGNFGINRDKGEWFDRYRGTELLMPYAKAVSAKTYDFEESRPFVTIDSRWQKETDYKKMMKIVADSGYTGWVGIEYEGGKLDEFAGIKASKKLLERSIAELG
ncbi:sugar phosphate isomerase/epimerase family protein [Fuerstiella marisgermanici]|uniref:Hydroxypyruvate isomerase n=1 Tax=Fuerstiella marisgermanici TaxID=1891926 RepID=A0A1P8WKL2_9PLAN|nr:sugar phosphate isomerase/epimerase family protein [Fuerstiella marisgermanici]APZ94577.1 Hydroxypyruvate isomerase [Fuerstiella marisgermanici]